MLQQHHPPSEITSPREAVLSNLGNLRLRTVFRLKLVKRSLAIMVIMLHVVRLFERLRFALHAFTPRYAGHGRVGK
jgi:hypothetical protein